MVVLDDGRTAIGRAKYPEMTYCVGWRTNDAVFLAADAAVTSSIAENRDPTTSFGERHVRETGRNVYEGALKIVRMGDAALTFAGDADDGFLFAQQVAAQINSGYSPGEAFRRTVSSMAMPSTGPKVFAIFGFVEDARPMLLTFNGFEKGEIRTVPDIVQIGLRFRYQEQVGELTVHLEADLPDPQDRLACLVGFCQSLGVRSYLLEDGVGGPFCGCFVDPSGFHWLPDMSFHLYSGRPDEGGSFDEGEAVVSLVRDDIFFVSSPFTGGTHAWHNTGLRQRSNEELIRETQTRAEEINMICGAQTFDYSVVIGKDTAATVVVRMNKNLITRHLGHRLNVSRTSERVAHMTSGFSGELGEFLKGEGRPPDLDPEIPSMRFIPYQPAQLAD